MGFVELALAASLAALLLVQGGLTLAFVIVVRKRLAQRPILQNPAPDVEVVLCLRGADPTLPAVLESLAKQTYPGRWHLLVMVDSRSDPSWPIANHQIKALDADGVATWRTTRILELSKISKDGITRTGSLKCMALSQAFTVLHPRSSVIAMVDADAVVQSDWLERITAACTQPGIGAVWGNRWYCPEAGDGPGEVRAFWNMGALVMMTVLGIPWGGSLAVRREVIATSSWTNQLRTSFGEDTALPRALYESGWNYQFRPELLVVDYGKPKDLCSVGWWITRQCFSARVSSRTWPLIAILGAGQLFLMTLTAILGVIMALNQACEVSIAGLLALTLYELGCNMLAFIIQRCCHKCLANEGKIMPLCEPTSAIARQGAILLSQIIHGLAIAKAQLANKIEWRGITYILKGGMVSATQDFGPRID